MKTHLTVGDRAACGTARAKLTTDARAGVDCKRCLRTRAYRQQPREVPEKAVAKKSYRLSKPDMKPWAATVERHREPDLPDAVGRVAFWQSKCETAERETAKLRVELADHLKSAHAHAARTLNGRVPSILGW